MTILEAIQSNQMFSDISEDNINTILIGRSIDGATVYDSDTLKEVELVSADLYSNMALLSEFKEGQLSVKYNPDMLLKLAEGIYRKHNDPKLIDFEPKVLNVGLTRIQ